MTLCQNNDILFLKQEANTYYDFGNNNDEEEWFVDEILAHNESIMTWNYKSSGCFVPISFWSSFQNMEVNQVSLSDTMD